MSSFVGTSEKTRSVSGLENSKVNISAQEQELNDRFHFLKIEYEKYKKCKINYECLQESVQEHSDLSEALKNKIKCIILGGTCCQHTLDISSYKISSMILGIENIGNFELTYAENKKLQHVLKHKLEKKYKSITNEFQKAYKKVCEVNDLETRIFEVKLEDNILLEYKNQLVTEKETYIKNLLSLLSIFEEITNLRLNTLPEVTQQKIKECSLRSRINYLKSQLVRDKTQVDVFAENSSSLNAYKELLKDIKEQQKQCDNDIEELRELKEKYKNVSCREYDNILKSYLQYKSSVEKKKLLYDCLKS